MNYTETYHRLKDKIQTNKPVKWILHHTGGIKEDPLADTSHHTLLSLPEEE